MQRLALGQLRVVGIAPEPRRRRPDADLTLCVVAALRATYTGTKHRTRGTAMRSLPRSRASHAIPVPPPIRRWLSVDVWPGLGLGRGVSQFGWCCLLAVLCAPVGAQPPGPSPANPADGSPRVPGFGPLRGQRAVPGFGTDTMTQVSITAGRSGPGGRTLAAVRQQPRRLHRPQ